MRVVDAPALPERDTPHGTTAVALYFDRPPAVDTPDTLFIAFDDFQRVGRHLVERFQRDQLHARRAGEPRDGPRRIVRNLAQYGPCNIIGDIAATDYDHPASNVERRAEGHRAQQIDAAIHPGATLPRQPQRP